MRVQSLARGAIIVICCMVSSASRYTRVARPYLHSREVPSRAEVSEYLWNFF